MTRRKRSSSKTRKRKNPQILGLPDFVGDIIVSALISYAISYYFYRKEHDPLPVVTPTYLP